MYTTLFNELIHKWTDTLSDTSVTAAPIFMSDRDIRTALDCAFADIHTLDDYESIIKTITSLETQLTPRFIKLLFDALSIVEKRVWLNSGMDIDIICIYKNHKGLLLANFVEFVLSYEKDIIECCKERGYFDNEQSRAFIVRRNEIYAKYVDFISRILDEGVNYDN